MLLVLIVVIIFYTNKKFAWMDSLRLRLQRGGGEGNDGGLENPSYPQAGYSAGGDNATVTSEFHF